MLSTTASKVPASECQLEVYTPALCMEELTSRSELLTDQPLQVNNFFMQMGSLFLRMKPFYPSVFSVESGLLHLLSREGLHGWFLTSTGCWVSNRSLGRSAVLAPWDLSWKCVGSLCRGCSSLCLCFCLCQFYCTVAHLTYVLVGITKHAGTPATAYKN
jgi:hypothetical protein